ALIETKRNYSFKDRADENFDEESVDDDELAGSEDNDYWEEDDDDNCITDDVHLGLSN
ncbi:hypothetical protein SNEBB_003053, partial [Seison nebaliae]